MDKNPAGIKVKRKVQNDGRSQTEGFVDGLDFSTFVMGMFAPSTELTVSVPRSLSFRTVPCYSKYAQFSDSKIQKQTSMSSIRKNISLRIPCMLGRFAGSALTKAIETVSGARCYLHTKNSLGFYLDGSNYGVCPTITGTSTQLKVALDKIKEDCIETYARSQAGAGEYKRCSLRVAAPSATTMDRLIAACHQCQDNPGTVGVDVCANAFYAVKTVRDMKTILAVMSSSAIGPSQSTLTSLEVFDLEYPKKGVF